MYQSCLLKNLKSCISVSIMQITKVPKSHFKKSTKVQNLICEKKYKSTKVQKNKISFVKKSTKVQNLICKKKYKQKIKPV